VVVDAFTPLVEVLTCVYSAVVKQHVHLFEGPAVQFKKSLLKLIKGDIKERWRWLTFILRRSNLLVLKVVLV